MPGKTGLRYAEMKDWFQMLLLSLSVNDFEYVKTALNLRADYFLLKPVNKVEMGYALEKFSTKSINCQELANRLIHDEEEFRLSQAEVTGLVSRKRLISSSYRPQANSTLYLDQEEEAMIEKAFWAPLYEHFRQFKDLVELALYVTTKDEEVHYYHPTDLRRTRLAGKMILKMTTPRFHWPANPLIQFFDGFEYRKEMIWADVVKKPHDATLWRDDSLIR